MLLDFGTDLINLTDINSVHLIGTDIQILSNSNLYTVRYQTSEDAQNNFYLLVRKFRDGEKYIKLTGSY